MRSPIFLLCSGFVLLDLSSQELFNQNSIMHVGAFTFAFQPSSASASASRMRILLGSSRSKISSKKQHVRRYPFFSTQSALLASASDNGSGSGKGKPKPKSKKFKLADPKNVKLNALTAADSILIPIQCEYFALEGLGKLLNTIRTVQDYQNNQLTIEGLLLTMHDGRLRLSNQVVDEVRQHFQDLVFKTMIARNVRLSEAPSFGQPIMVHDAGSTGADNYLNLAQEILARNPQLPH